jgi:hypothetical protein
MKLYAHLSPVFKKKNSKWIKYFNGFNTYIKILKKKNRKKCFRTLEWSRPKCIGTKSEHKQNYIKLKKLLHHKRNNQQSEPAI